jgi:cell division septal protein FtsQ
VLPQKPSKPNRPKMLALALALAVLAGVGAVVAMEMLNNTIWTTRDLYGLAHAHLIVPIPYIATRKEMVQRRARAMIATGTFAGVVLVGVLSTHFLLRPLDQMWTSIFARLLG